MTPAATPLRTALACVLLCPPPGAQEARFRESVDVERVVVDVRVMDDRGRAVVGLGPADFVVRVEGAPVPVETASWVAGEPLRDPPPAGAGGVPLDSSSPGGRLILLLFQRDAFQGSRIAGILKILPRIEEFLSGVTAQDRVAVLVFDSHLRLHLDFTGDVEAIRRAVVEMGHLGPPRPSVASPGPSLEALLPTRERLEAATPEQALLVVARALSAVPGPKSLVLLGWGIGHWIPGAGVSMDQDYEAARTAMGLARISVFALDVTQADAHSLAAGLQTVAEDTGGFYLSTYTSPDLGMAWLRGALSGHYAVAFVKPRLSRGRHALSVGLARGVHGTVLAKRAYEG